MSAQQVGDTLQVYFRQNSTKFDPAYKGNAERCDAFIQRMKAFEYSPLFYLQEVDILATASPEGTVAINTRLSGARAKSMSDYLRDHIDLPDSLVVVRTVPEDYDGLLKFVEEDKNVPDRDATLKILRNANGSDPEYRIKALNGGKTWYYLYENYFSLLRFSIIYVMVETNPFEKVFDQDEEVVSEEAFKYTPLETSGPVLDPMPFVNQYTMDMTLKTNLIGWGMLGANLAIEIDIIPHLAFAMPIHYSGGLDYFKPTIKFRGLSFQPGLRYYPWLTKGKNEGFFVGAHFGMGWYNFALDGDYRIQDHHGCRPSYGGGLDLGYAFQFKNAPRWGMEFQIGGGVYDSKYDMFYNEENGPYHRTAIRKTWFGVDNVSISFTYKFAELKGKGGKK
ncbi:MAG: DUF3575 domain-containing protein [Bacteroidales bacterium]|nr:DUF3575 domain-containing protein [Bacteroidales bacterium]